MKRADVAHSAFVYNGMCVCVFSDFMPSMQMKFHVFKTKMSRCNWKTFVEMGFCRHKNDDVDDQFAVATRVPNVPQATTISLCMYCVQFTVYIISKVYLRRKYIVTFFCLLLGFHFVLSFVWLKSFFFFLRTSYHILSFSAHLHGIMK